MAISVGASQTFVLDGRPLVAARSSVNVTFAELLCRIRAEYLEMPGLQLTAPQARCLFGLDSETWDAVLAALVDAKFLSRTPNGMFAIASDTGAATGRTSRIGVDSRDTK
jgi:hypothetical protein